MHYQMLIQLVNAEMGQMVNAIPSPSQNQHCDDMIPPFPIMLDESTPINGRKYQNAHQPPPFSFDPKVPSNYLHSKCPCCFGSSFTLRSQLSAHCIVSFDANFQLKRIKDYDWRFAHTKPGFQDPEMMSPLTMEVSQVYAEVSQLTTGCVTCHTCHGCVTDFRPILGNPVEVTHVTSPGHVYIFPR